MYLGFPLLSFHLFVGNKRIHLNGSLKEAGKARRTRGTQTEIRDSSSSNEHNTDNNKRGNRTKAAGKTTTRNERQKQYRGGR